MLSKHRLAAAGSIFLFAGSVFAQAQSGQSGDTDLDSLLGSSSTPQDSAVSGPSQPPAESAIGNSAEGDLEADATAVAPRRASRNRLVEEIVVTAQKREENLQDVPISVSAFSADALDAKGIDDPKDLAQFTPGLYYGQTVNFSVIYIRGVGSDAFLPDSDPSIATYIDGIYYPFANGQSQAFGAVERVEVLKGPQGTLFGRNSTGGAINIVTKNPGEDPEASLMSSYQSFSNFNTRAYFSVPFSDSFAASVSATYNQYENYYEGTRDNGTEELPTEYSKGVRVKLRWSPFDSIDFNLAGLKFVQEGVASTAMPNVAPSLLAQGLGIRAQTEPYKVDVDVPVYFGLDNEVVYGQFDWRPTWFDFKLLGSKQDITTDNYYDFDGSDTPFITFDARGQFADIKTAEFQFLSNGEWGPDWLEWIVGGFYLDQTSGFPLNRLSVLSLDLSDNFLSIPNPLGGGPLSVPLPEGLIDFLSTIPGVPDGVSVGLVSLLGTESFAFFTQETIHFNDWLHVTVGGRYQEEKRRVIESSANLANLDGSATQLLDFNRPFVDSSNFSPKGVVSVDVADGVMVYGSWSKGYKSGTFNTVNVYTPPEYVEPEEVTTTELGFKGEFFDGLLRFNAAVFENKIENLQVQFISLLSGGAVNLENAGSARIRGFDFDMQVSPLPNLDPGLVLTLGGSYLDSEYTDYVNGSTYEEVTGLYNFATGDFTGNEVTRTPKFSGTLGINQLIEVATGDVELAASAYYNDGFYYLASNSPVSREDSYYVVDAQISYLHAAWNTRFTVFGKNLNDAQYTYSQFHTDAGRQDFLAPPRTYGFRVNWDF